MVRFRILFDTGVSNLWSCSVQIDQAGHSDKPVQDPRVKFAAIFFPPAVSSASSDTSELRNLSSSKLLQSFSMLLLLWLENCTWKRLQNDLRYSRQRFISG